MTKQATKIFAGLSLLFGSLGAFSHNTADAQVISSSDTATINVTIGDDTLASEMFCSETQDGYLDLEEDQLFASVEYPQEYEISDFEVKIKDNHTQLFWDGDSWESDESWLETSGWNSWVNNQGVLEPVNWDLPIWESLRSYNLSSRASLEDGTIIEDLTNQSGTTCTASVTPLGITPDFIVVYVGSQTDFNEAPGYEGVPFENDDDGYEWSVENTNIGTVTSTGIFIAQQVGITHVNIHDSVGQTDTGTVVVINRSQHDLILVPPYSHIYVGETVDFLALDGMGDAGYTWSEINDNGANYGNFDSDETLINVNTFTAMTPGITEVKVVNDLGDWDTAIIVISERRSDLELIPEYAQIPIGDEQEFTVIGGVPDYNWWLSDENIASWEIEDSDSIMTTGLAEGYTLVVVQDSEGNYDTGLLEVGDFGPSDHFRLIPHSAILPAACSELQFSTDGGVSPFEWGSTNNTAGFVDTRGLFSPFTPGNTTISVRDDSSLLGRIRIAFVGMTDGYPISEIAINPGSASVLQNQTFQFSASDGVGPYTWEITDPNIGTIDSNGFFTANDVIGHTSIVARDSEGRSDVAPIFVFDEDGPPNAYPKDYDFTIAPGFALLILGESTNYVALGEFEGNVSWSVIDENVATIDEDGFLTTVGEGKTAVVATDSMGAKAYSTIGVIENCATDWTVVPPYSEVYPGDEVQLLIEGEPTGGVVWSSARPTIGTVDYNTGLVTAQNPGIVIITATDSIGRTGYAIVNVLDPNDREFRVTPPEVTVVEGDTFQFDTIGEVGEVTWETEDGSRVSIDQNGVITGLQETNNEFITIRATDSIGQTDTARVRVIKSYDDFYVTPPDVTLPPGETFTPTVVGGCSPYTFRTDNPNVAVVNQQGNITAVAPGIAIITVTDCEGRTATVTVRVPNPNPVIPPRTPDTGTNIGFELILVSLALAATSTLISKKEYFLRRKRHTK